MRPLAGAGIIAAAGEVEASAGEGAEAEAGTEPGVGAAGSVEADSAAEPGPKARPRERKAAREGLECELADAGIIAVAGAVVPDAAEAEEKEGDLAVEAATEGLFPLFRLPAAELKGKTTL